MGNLLVSIVQRIGRGLMGSWGIFGPMLLIFGHSQLPGGLVAMVSVWVLIFYAVAVWKWRRQGLGFIKAVGRDTFLLFLFVVVGSSISGVVSAFGGPAMHMMALNVIFPVLGFLILEILARDRRRTAASLDE